MKIVVASDSFKGSLTSSEVADCVGQGILEVFPCCDVVKVAVSDGGDGMLECFSANPGGDMVEVNVSDPLGRMISAAYLILEESGTAIIEMASAGGLALLTPQERNPLKTSTYGVGQMIADALSRGCRRFLIGLGGSATNDAGMGMFKALGFRFLDAQGNELCAQGASLGAVDKIDMSGAHEALSESVFTIACDVDSPFAGPDGAAYVYAPQKGASPQMVEELDRGLRHFSRLVERTTGTDMAVLKGAGAAGGSGGTFKAFLDAELCRGADMILDALGFDEIIKDADLVITGEGRVDSQTMTGKLPYAVAVRANAHNVPVVAVCGTSDVVSLPQIDHIYPISPPGMSVEVAMKPDVASGNLIRTVKDIIKMRHLQHKS